MVPRWVHRCWAWLGGYFWLPCPKCGRMFGGHERGRTLWNDSTRATGRMMCPLHPHDEIVDTTRIAPHSPGCHCYCCNAPDGSLYQDQLTGEWWQKQAGVWLLGRLVFEPKVDAGGMPEGQVGESGSPSSPPASAEQENHGQEGEVI